jgi:hypothetical protein
MMAARLNGWQRLWIVVSVLYLLSVVVLTAIFWPTFETTEHQEEFIARMPQDARMLVVASYASEWSAREDRRGFVHIMPNRAVLLLQGAADPRLVGIRKKYPEYNDLSDAELVSRLRAKFPEYADLAAPVIADGDIQKVVTAYFGVVQQATRTARWSIAKIALLAWLIPCVALYAFGWAVAWVRRGFRSGASGPTPTT